VWSISQHPLYLEGDRSFQYMVWNNQMREHNLSQFQLSKLNSRNTYRMHTCAFTWLYLPYLFAATSTHQNTIIKLITFHFAFMMLPPDNQYWYASSYNLAFSAISGEAKFGILLTWSKHDNGTTLVTKWHKRFNIVWK
jgi:hypothetical protein